EAAIADQFGDESYIRLEIAKNPKMKDARKLELIQQPKAEKNIAVAEKTIRQAEENFRISQVRYQEQVTTSLEVMDAQTLLTQAKNNTYQALYAYNLAHSRLLRAMGTW
ncbi:MAG: hypothetical protein C0407_11075, partial [Desulfobacca sp.]|nr:hypothetical protein [Desulfobacca sp.]